jgi:pimeloyl-ACP methyl ester carboxylesterase
MDIKKIINKLGIEDGLLGGFSMGGAIAIRYASIDKGAHFTKLALFGAAAPVWTQRDNFPYNLTKADVDELINLNHSDRPQLLDNFAKIFSATENSLNNGLSKWLFNIGLSASSFATAQCLVALRDTDLRPDMENITIPTLIMHGVKDKICSFELAEQMKALLVESVLIPFENSGHSLFLEEREKFNSELINFALK